MNIIKKIQELEAKIYFIETLNKSKENKKLKKTFTFWSIVSFLLLIPMVNAFNYLINIGVYYPNVINHLIAILSTIVLALILIFLGCFFFIKAYEV